MTDKVPREINARPYMNISRPRWLSWMHRPTGDQEVAGSTPAEVGNILSWRLIVKYFLRSFSLPLIKEGRLSVTGERMCTILVNHLEDQAVTDKVPREMNARLYMNISRPRWLSWMCRPTGDQEVAGSTPAEVGNILSSRSIVKYFLRSFSPFR